MAAIVAGVGFNSAFPVHGQQVKLTERKPDPHGTPRPAKGAQDVPLRTSFYLEFEPPAETEDNARPQNDQVDPQSVAIRLEAEGREPRDILRTGQRFEQKGSGWLRPKPIQQFGAAPSRYALAVYVEPGEPLEPETTYTVRVTARSEKGAELPKAGGTWRFTTEAARQTHKLDFSLDLAARPVEWDGKFFSGVCNVVFCSSAETFNPTYDLMLEAHKQHPRAWSYQRDMWLTGTEDRKPWWAMMLNTNLPNIVRERETRRIASMEKRGDDVLLRVEDFFGHQQYGIPSGRPPSEDYHPGNEVLIADGASHALAKVISADDEARTVLVSPFDSPEEGWKIAYDAPLPEKENPDAPGLFPPGGCYLRKFKPHGTACYYWGRLDKESDLVHRRYDRRLLPNFCDAPGDLSLDGRSWTTVKDYAQWHEVARTIAGHLIDRYGEDSLDFTWSIFNEPDLGAAFWRSDWDELQRYYDYTTDAVLRAFEDRGYDSSRVRIGGLELGAIFGPHLKLREFLAHCSPNAQTEQQVKGALLLNAAVADERLDGRRSRRVEELCGKHGGRGAPCDFVSIHAYNRSEIMAAKLIKAKEMALEIDAEYYRRLWINSHESCPDWSLPPDEAAADCYLGNGYFPTWCADVVGRQLAQASGDPRYAFGETIITVWPPPQNFAGLNAVTRILHCDDDGDGRADRKVTIPSPIFHVLTLLSDLGQRYWVLPRRQVGSHVVSGFASRDDKGVVRVLLYSHHAEDTQSRSDASFDVSLELAGLAGKRAGKGDVRVTEYRFDREHNTYFEPARALRNRVEHDEQADPEQLKKLLATLAGDDVQAKREALERLERLGPAAKEALPALAGLALKQQDEPLRDLAQRALKRIFGPAAYPRSEVERIRKLAALRETGSAKHSLLPDGRLKLNVGVMGNGVSLLVVR